MCFGKALVVNRDVAKVQVGQRVVWVFLQSIHIFFLGGIQLMLDPIRYPNCIMNSRGVGTFPECRLVLFDSFRVPFFIRVNLSHESVQLERVLIQGLQSLNRLKRSVLVNAGKLVKRVSVLRILSYCAVQLRDGFIDSAGSLERQREIVPTPAVWFRSSEFQLKASDRLVEVILAELGHS